MIDDDWPAVAAARLAARSDRFEQRLADLIAELREWTRPPHAWGSDYTEAQKHVQDILDKYEQEQG